MTTQINNPRITIQYCTQCKWMLRAAYFAQELLSTFSTQLGEVALVPATGGLFAITLFYYPVEDPQSEGQPGEVQETLLWDRKRDGGFPEVKTLKSLVRNVIDPQRDLGHTDRALRGASSTAVPTTATTGDTAAAGAAGATGPTAESAEKKEECTDCR
ncbi:SelT/SelW/SelH family protein [Aspergillus candidus]|uniref:Rdx family-domain-containing protein n=1 Tax=Aspergillus candidus TaxID=41067 RepID=A0A2I2F6E6_ASPCN|nr:Rdx family-domain-containing protein [Aspergillus candidus]PLB36197.1 Rdx family-domain-containing protein [Aspergillus candidus]